MAPDYRGMRGIKAPTSSAGLRIPCAVEVLQVGGHNPSPAPDLKLARWRFEAALSRLDSGRASDLEFSGGTRHQSRRAVGGRSQAAVRAVFETQEG